MAANLAYRGLDRRSSVDVIAGSRRSRPDGK